MYNYLQPHKQNIAATQNKNWVGWVGTKNVQLFPAPQAEHAVKQNNNITFCKLSQC